MELIEVVEVGVQLNIAIIVPSVTDPIIGVLLNC